tara:strand:- start:308 stop:469 length:162 start_codon:yes stop_codon:yes gene_type:complete
MSNPDPKSELNDYIQEKMDEVLEVVSLQRKHIGIAIAIMTPEQQEEFFNKVRD